MELVGLGNCRPQKDPPTLGPNSTHITTAWRSQKLLGVAWGTYGVVFISHTPRTPPDAPGRPLGSTPRTSKYTPIDVLYPIGNRLICGPQYAVRSRDARPPGSMRRLGPGCRSPPSLVLLHRSRRRGLCDSAEGPARHFRFYGCSTVLLALASEMNTVVVLIGFTCPATTVVTVTFKGSC